MKTKLVIFGLSGDLGKRKLMPALKQIISANAIPHLEIIGISRREIDLDDFFAKAFGNDFAKKSESKKLRESTEFFQMDLAKLSDYDKLKEFLGDDDDTQIMFYLSVPPAAATDIVDNLGLAGINKKNVKIMFEKPFGFDLVSAKEMISRTSKYFSEEQIYRVDHFLAKEMSQNIIAMRYGNALFSRIWDNNSIESVDVIASEQIGIEGRSVFYEQTGALRDILQGHSMQLLALSLAEIPEKLNWNDLPLLRLAALRDLEIAKPEDSFRAQYRGYREEVANPKSSSETAAGVKLFSRNPKFAGIPFRLLTGKNLSRKTTEIRINLKREHLDQENAIVFHIQPDEGAEMKLFAKKPGYSREFIKEKMSFAFSENAGLADAYEQVFVDAANSRKSLFASSDEIIRQWEIMDPIRNAWDRDEMPLNFYEPGTDIDQLFANL